MGILPPNELRRLQAVASDDRELDRLIQRRQHGEPLQYIEGSAAFGPFDLVVDTRVLVPRPETEQLWELAVPLVEDPIVIVDLCTGSGALAIALAHSFPTAHVIGTDLSDSALDVARINGRRLASQVRWSSGDLFGALPRRLRGKVDLVVSNPPYVAHHEYDDLPIDVHREPRSALVSGVTGLEILQRLAAGLGEWLAPEGRFAIEIGETQGIEASELFAGFGARVHRDLTGRDRFLTGERRR